VHLPPAQRLATAHQQWKAINRSDEHHRYQELAKLNEGPSSVSISSVQQSVVASKLNKKLSKTVIFNVN